MRLSFLGFLCFLFVGCHEWTNKKVSAEKTNSARELHSPNRQDANWIDSQWIDTWANSHLSTQVTKATTEIQTTVPAQINNQTMRLIIWNQLAGNEVRVRFSNQFSSTPLEIGGAHIALLDESAEATPGSILLTTDRTLLFSGNKSITLAPGEERWSDAVHLDVLPSTNLAVSIYLPGTFTPVQFHPTALKTSYLFNQTGDKNAEVKMPADAATTKMNFFINDVQIKPLLTQKNSRAPKVLVALGDSITDGAGADVDTNSNWPSHLAKRLAKNSAGQPIAVINMGIGSNRFCASDGAGPAGLKRLPKDVLSRAHIKWLIFFEGINDISYEHISAPDLIACYKNAIAQARAMGIKVYQSPLLPIKHSVKDTPKNEATRSAVNHWIRTSSAEAGGPDAVIDFEAAVWDPNDQLQILPSLTVDHVHPNSLGYQKMAEAIDLNLFR